MAGRPRIFTYRITDAERENLGKMVRASTSQRRHVERAKVILLADEGKTNAQIAEEVGISTVTVCKILKKLSMIGVEGALDDSPRSGRPEVFTMEAKAWIISLACQMPNKVKDGPPLQLWSISALGKYVREHCTENDLPELAAIGDATVWGILNENAIKPHRIGYYLVKKDPEFEDKAKKVLLMYKRVEWILQWVRDDVKAGARADELCGEVFISYDEKPGVQAIANIAEDLPPQQGKGKVLRDYEYRRLGTVSLLAGIDLLNGEVTGIVRDTHRSVEFIEFLDMLDAKYSKDLKINIVLDNHSVHRSKDVVNYLAAKPGRFAFTFTPTHASWLNLVEGFFSKLAKQALRGLRVASKAELVKRIEDWIETTNKEPVVYSWKWCLEDIDSAFTGSR